ncbi:MAG: ATP-binding protein [Bacteroidota bacterium]
MLKKNTVKDLAIISAIAIAYAAGAKTGSFFIFPEVRSSVFWIASGIGIYTILKYGNKALIGIGIGSFIFNMTSSYQQMGYSSHLYIAPTFYAIGNCLEAYLGKVLFDKWIENKNLFCSYKNGSSFFLLSLLASAPAAIIGSLTILAMYDGLVSDTKIIFLTWWLGDTTGVFLTVPLLLAIETGRSIDTVRMGKNDLLYFLVVTTIIIILATSDNHASSLVYASPIIIASVVVIVCLRLNILTSLIFLVLTSVASIAITIHGIGPFVELGEFNSLLLHQIFIITLSTTLIIISGAVNQLRASKSKIENFNLNLEKLVKERTEEVRKANDNLIKANRELDNFVYSVSHDLRAPIASSLGLINVSRIEPEPEKVMSYLDIQEKSLKKLDSFIKDILDYSRNSRMEISRSPFSLFELVNEVFMHHRFISKTKVVDLQNEIDSSLEAITDRRRLQVILNNLVSNAIRYADLNKENPFVSIRSKKKDKRLHIFVEDNGVGIDEIHLINIFEMFFKATDHIKTGSGLGLYIVKETVDRLEGDIGVESKIGKGTTFEVVLPD